MAKKKNYGAPKKANPGYRQVGPPRRAPYRAVSRPSK